MADDTKIIEHPDGSGTLIRVPADLDTGDAKVVGTVDSKSEEKPLKTEAAKVAPEEGAKQVPEPKKLGQK